MTDCDKLPLEIVLLEMQLQFADFVSTSFETSVLKAIEPEDGTLLFNERTDGDKRFQRAAAVKFARGDICLIFLSRDGQSAVVEEAKTSAHPIAKKALAYAKNTNAER